MMLRRTYDVYSAHSFWNQARISFIATSRNFWVRFSLNLVKILRNNWHGFGWQKAEIVRLRRKSETSEKLRGCGVQANIFQSKSSFSLMQLFSWLATKPNKQAHWLEMLLNVVLWNVELLHHLVAIKLKCMKVIKEPSDWCGSTSTSRLYDGIHYIWECF